MFTVIATFNLSLEEVGTPPCCVTNPASVNTEDDEGDPSSNSASPCSRTRGILKVRHGTSR
jgi:hypothetical protein